MQILQTKLGKLRENVSNPLIKKRKKCALFIVINI